ncbi:MAG: MAE_28990/MAE_18760 family HEPN-like nuclease [Methylocystis sp.]
MRSPDDLFQDLESDRLQREAELRLIENFASRAEVEAERNMLLRSLVLLTYAHLEGFCKFALLAYAGSVNALAVPCREAAFPVLAASLGDIFAALRNPNSKAPEFRSNLPDDGELHMLWRERTFVESYEAILCRSIEIPDRVIDTKANLNTVVLKRNLYQLGLDYPAVERHRGAIDRLLNVRNAIAHGDALRVPSPEHMREYTVAVFDVMQFVQNGVFVALRDGAFRRTHAA